MHFDGSLDFMKLKILEPTLSEGVGVGDIPS